MSLEQTIKQVTGIAIPKVEFPDINLEYKPFAGHRGSDKDNWVLVDFVNAKLASILGVGDEKSNTG